MDEGEIVESGDPQSFLSRPQHPNTAIPIADIEPSLGRHDR